MNVVKHHKKTSEEKAEGLDNLLVLIEKLKQVEDAEEAVIFKNQITESLKRLFEKKD